jgi:octaprenyl-diphosphate synthase
LADDLLDYAGDPSQTGKNVGDDLREGKITLPLLHAMKAGTLAQRERVAEVLRQKEGDAFAEIIEIVRQTGGIEATREAATHHQALAQAALKPLPTSDALNALNQMAEKAVDRQA